MAHVNFLRQLPKNKILCVIIDPIPGYDWDPIVSEHPNRIKSQIP